MNPLRRSVATRLAPILVIGLLIPGSALAGDKTDQIKELLGRFHEYGLFNGSALVAEHGKVIFKGGFGLANMEWGIPNAADTKFRIGSITKQFTATAIMQLVAEGKIDLQAPISTYLPNYRKDIGEKVTVHHLLSHTSGIPSYTGMPEFRRDAARDPFSPDEFMARFCSRDLEFEPGTQFRYNNSGYFLLGVIIERVTGQTYGRALKQHIFDRAQMHDTGYDRTAPVLKKRASGYERTLDGHVNAPYLDMSAPYAAGALYSTVEDLFRWDHALYTDDLLSKPYREQMYEPHMNDFAYGWVNRRQPIGDDGRTVQVIGHGGAIDGFNSVIERLVEDQHLIVLLNNTGRAPLGQMTSQIINILYGEPYQLPDKPLAPELVRLALDSGIDEAVARYTKWKETHAESSDSPERGINSAGYAQLQSGNTEAALKLFQLNVTLFPESANTYDSLAEAQHKAGMRNEAVINYAKSLTLNPNNANAVRQLEKVFNKPE